MTMVHSSPAGMSPATRSLRVMMISTLAELSATYHQDVIDMHVCVDVVDKLIVGMDVSQMFGMPPACRGIPVPLKNLKAKHWITMLYS